jgi:hypothetical protein
VPLPNEPIATGPAPAGRVQSSTGPKVELWAAGFLLILCLWAALNVDPVRTGIGLKGDEATYAAIALSAAYDHDLAFDRQDLERFWAVYQCGPDGIFLKRGKMLRVKFTLAPPFVRLIYWGDAPGDKLYFGKAFIHGVVAAPFVRVLGLKGLLVLNVLLMAAIVWCGYLFARTRAPSPYAMAVTVAFFGASIVPIYMVWFTPEIFNLALVFYAYFFWLYKEVAPPANGRFASFMRGRGTDVVAAILLGLVTFSKPLNVLMAGPFVLLLWWRRKWLAGLVVGVVFVATIAGSFGANAAVSGEFNYQGSDTGSNNRKIFYTWFPFANKDATFETARGGSSMVTSDADAENVFARDVFLPRLARNIYYFVVGRHFGLLPYFFPALVIVGLWLWKRREMLTWQVLAFLAVAGSSLGVLIMLPYTWSGGGGPPGNRYFLNFYPALFFLVPSLRSIGPALVAWVGGLLFTAQALVNPFMASRLPYLNVDHGAVRMLPVELTMVNDLPINLDRLRCRLPFGRDPVLSLYLIDENIYPPEPAGIWTHGQRRGDLLIRTKAPLSGLRVTLSSPLPNSVWLSYEGRTVTVPLKPGERMEVLLSSTGGVFADRGYGSVLSVKSSNGFVPMNADPASSDNRYLGVLMQLQGIERK